MPRAMRLAVCTALGAVLSVAVLNAPADAQDKPSAQYTKAYADGEDAFNAAAATGDYSEAKVHFNKALAFSDKYPGPYRFLGVIAKIEKDYTKCLELAFIAIKRNPKSPKAPLTRKLHAECREALGRPKFRDQFQGGGAIAVYTPGIDGAKVKLNGLTYGATPFEPRAFAVGVVVVEVEARGYLSAKAEAGILEGLVTDVTFTLKRDPNAKVDDCVAKGTCPNAEVENGWVTISTRPPGARITMDGKVPTPDKKGRIKAKPGVYDTVIEAEGHESWHRRVRVSRGQEKTLDVILRANSARRGMRKKGYAALGVAAGFALTGAIFGVLELQAVEDAQDIWEIETERPDPAVIPISESSKFFPVHTRADLKDAKDRSDRYALISGVSFGLAAVALGASVYYFVKERSDNRPGFLAPLAVTPIIPTDSNTGVGASVTYTTELSW